MCNVSAIASRVSPCKNNNTIAAMVSGGSDAAIVLPKYRPGKIKGIN